jgi:hypothetical protein
MLFSMRRSQVSTAWWTWYPRFFTIQLTSSLPFTQFS